MAKGGKCCAIDVQAHDYRRKVEQLNQAIKERSAGWTLLACVRAMRHRSALLLALEALNTVVETMPELLAAAMATSGPLLLICADAADEIDALALQQQLRGLQRQDPVRLLVCVGRETPCLRLQQLWQSAADGLISLEATGEGQLLEAVLTVLRGMQCLDPQVGHRLRRSTGDTATAAHPVLNEREQELLRWLARGRSAAEIAAMLQLRCDTVRRQLSQLYRRTGVRNQRSLLAWGLEQGLLRPHDLECQLR